RPVAFAEDCVGERAESVVANLKDGEVALFENTRFHPGEEKNDPEFARALAKLGEFFVNDAFSAAHRAHASTEGVARLLPSAAGRAMESELKHLEKALEAPERPLMAVVGGAKISTKIDLLKNLIDKVDVLVIAGAMANTFFAAQGFQVGRSLIELDQRDTARAIMNDKVVLPTDVVVAEDLKPNAANRITGAGDVTPYEMILDVGPRTVQQFARRLDKMKT